MTRAHILICEDDALLAMDLASLLSAHGYAAVGPATNAQDAFDIVDTQPISAAVIDINLADGRTGVMLAREMQRRGLPVILCSADLLGPEELMDVKHIFVSKPVDSEQIWSCLASILPATDRAVALQSGDIRNHLRGATLQLD